ncbi:MAG: hypothetical protein ACE5R6_21075 [Candidatus Heimdallarchaeota archaeon]
MPTHGEMIDKVSKELSEPFSMKVLVDTIIKRYGSIRQIIRESLKTDIRGCCVNLKSHRSLSDLPLILLNLRGRGERMQLRRYNPKKDWRANLYLNTGKYTKLHKSEGGEEVNRTSGTGESIYYDFKNAKKVLREKGMLSEILQIVKSLTKINHSEIQEAFRKKGWNIEYPIHDDVNWAWDAYKDKIPISIEFSLIDAVHRDFLRLLMWENQGRVDAMVYITAKEFKEVKFENVKRDLHIFISLIKIPILLIGLKST